MSQVPVMFRPLARYAEFEGRSNRAEYWLFILLIYLVTGAGYGLIYLCSLKGGHFDLDHFLANYMQFSPLMSVVSLGTLVPYLAVSVRRLHDSGRTGWWLIMPVIVSFAAYIVFFVVKGSEVMTIMMNMAEQMSTLDMSGPAMMNPVPILKLEWPLFQLMLPWVMIPSIVAQVALWLLMLLPGNTGDNRFGVPPARG